jgi:hypothetical protein
MEQAAGLAAPFEVARDGICADVEAVGHLLMSQAGVDGANKLLAEVEGIGFHPVVNTTPLPNTQ